MHCMHFLKTAPSSGLQAGAGYGYMALWYMGPQRVWIWWHYRMWHHGMTSVLVIGWVRVWIWRRRGLLSKLLLSRQEDVVPKHRLAGRGCIVRPGHPKVDERNKICKGFSALPSRGEGVVGGGLRLQGCVLCLAPCALPCDHGIYHRKEPTTGQCAVHIQGEFARVFSKCVADTKLNHISALIQLIGGM
jgi:hypothetical protein